MKSNGLLKWLMIPMALVLVLVGFKLFSSNRSPSKAPREADPQLAPGEMKALGIEGDTPRDTVATLVAQVKQLRTELQTATSDNKTARAENERLRQRESNVDQRIQSALENERSRLQQDRELVANERQQAQGLMQELQRRLDGMSKKGQSDMPVGLGLDDEAGQVGAARDSGATRWVEPNDAKPLETGKASHFPTTFAPAQKRLEAPEGTAAEPSGKAVSTPNAVYTVPANATLMGSTAMTALIGRVPVDGTVNDPYPFKVIIGADNLTANGIDLPDVAGAVVSGTSSGDWTLSCVRGQIRSITFVFQDGRIRTVPDDAKGSDSGSTGSGPVQGGLGWISDPHGIPCVTGERRSNAQEYLSSQTLITAAGAGAASLIKPGGGSVSVISNGSSSLGSASLSANEAMGRILSSGVQDMSQWVNKLYGQAFAAVYVEPGAKVAVHLEKPLHIDYDHHGRKVDHRIGATNATLSLD